MKKSSLIISSFLIIISIIYFAFNAAIPIAKVTEAIKGSAINAVPGNVKVISSMHSIVKTQATGNIENVLTPQNVGSVKVKKNDIIAKINITDINREIDHLKLRINAALSRKKIGSPLKLEIESLEKDINNLKTLLKHRQISEDELNKKNQDLKRLIKAYKIEKINHNLEINLLENELSRLLSQREKMIIRSPIDGFLTESYFLEGTHVYNGESIAKIISTENIIEVSVNEEDFPGIEIGQTVSINFLGYDNNLVIGKVVSLLATANSDTKRRSVYVSLNEHNQHLTPGMTGQASITKAIHNNVVIIPRSALTGNIVYIKNKGKVELRKVVPGFIGFDKVEIVKGVNYGDLVITEDIFSFKNGQRIKAIKI